MNNMIQRGALIVLEGCDRCGKTTQARKLVENLKKFGTKAEFLQFPDRTTCCGKIISQYLEQSEDLEDHTIHLLFSANRWENVPKMKKLLNDGITLVVDRYAYSGVAFSSVKKGLSIEWCKQSDVGLPKPDLVLFLELYADVAAKRGQYGGERYETKDIQSRVHENYMKLIDDSWKVINADKTVDDLNEQLLGIAKEIVSKPKNDLQRLWTDERIPESS